MYAIHDIANTTQSQSIAAAAEEIIPWLAFDTNALKIKPAKTSIALNPATVTASGAC